MVRPRMMAAMGGAYGNLAALAAYLVKVADANALPLATLGGTPENVRSGYVKLRYPGGLNLLFS